MMFRAGMPLLLAGIPALADLTGRWSTGGAEVSYFARTGMRLRNIEIREYRLVLKRIGK